MRLYGIHNTAAASQVQVYPRLKTFDTTTSTPLFVDLFFNEAYKFEKKRRTTRFQRLKCAPSVIIMSRDPYFSFSPCYSFSPKRKKTKPLRPNYTYPNTILFNITTKHYFNPHILWG